MECNDHGLWKQFWHQNQRYHTICLPCMADERGRDRVVPERDEPKKWDAMMLKDTSEVILSNWYRTAHVNVFGSKGKKRTQQNLGNISDDNEDDFSQRKWVTLPLDEIPKATSTIATIWLRSARAKLQNS